MAFFVPGIAGPKYRQRAIEAGMDLLQSVGYGTRETGWLRLGVAVNAGVAYVGNVGGAVVDFTALGDTVNVAARMQERAAAGELLIARGVADEIVARAPRHTLILKGHEQPMEAFVLAQVSGAILCPRGTLHTTKLTSNCSKLPEHDEEPAGAERAGGR